MKMRPNPIDINKNPELKLISISAIVLSLISLFSAIALAIPNSLTLQGKLTNLAGAYQQWILESDNDVLFHLE